MTNDTNITTFNTDLLDNRPELDYFSLIDTNIRISLGALSAKNRKEYQKTFEFWTTFCVSQNHDKHDFELGMVEKFLTDNSWSFNTRKTRLAHLRKYAEILAASDSDNALGFGFNFGRLGLLKPKALGGKKVVNDGKALTRRQVYKLFDAWHGNKNKNIRNRAILGLMILSGLRSSEVVSLKWTDIDYDNYRIFIRDGKGEKSEYVPILGDLAYLLQEWHIAQGANGFYEYICSQIYRSDKISDDKKCTTRIVSTIISDTTMLVDFTFKPHDTRRTAITLMLDDGASVADTQHFARHSSGETTLIYAKKSTVTSLSHKLNDVIKFGDVMGSKNHTKNGRVW